MVLHFLYVVVDSFTTHFGFLSLFFSGESSLSLICRLILVILSFPLFTVWIKLPLKHASTHILRFFFSLPQYLIPHSADTSYQSFNDGMFYVILPKGTVRAKQSTTSGMKTMIHIHGGGFVAGSFKTYYCLLSHLSATFGIRIIFVEYPLAPHHADLRVQVDFIIDAIDHAVKISRNSLEDQNNQWLVGFNPSESILCGDSAGGALALLVAQELNRRNHWWVPKAIGLMSPFLDLTNEFLTVENQKTDAIVDHRLLLRVAETATGRDPMKLVDPRYNSMRGSMHGLPPTRIAVGEYEVLLGHSIEVERRMKKAGVDVEVFVGAGMFHDHAIVGFPSEAAMARKRLIESLIELCCRC